MTQHTPPTQCPTCKEPVQANWRICPVCETRLQAWMCPQCGRPVKETWKRCPECEALLVCGSCHRRLLPGESACPTCGPETQADPLPPVFTDPVCGIEMVLVPAGRYRMGDTLSQGADNELPVHSVDLDAFYIARCCTTQAQWLTLMPDNPSRHAGDDHPVEQVSWLDVMRFVQALNQAGQGRYRVDLPTEAQWEYAARSGGKEELYAGGDDIQAVAWYADNSQGRPHAVGAKAPNGLGLYDMSGNVWEWCRDSYAADGYRDHSARNPWIDLPGDDRVIRGGSWHLDPWSARCARRFSCAAEFFGPALGFRLVREIS